MAPRVARSRHTFAFVPEINSRLIGGGVFIYRGPSCSDWMESSSSFGRIATIHNPARQVHTTLQSAAAAAAAFPLSRTW